MTWINQSTNIAYGFEGTLKAGTYVIADIELFSRNGILQDGIWQNVDSGNQVCVFTTGLGYYKVHDSQKTLLWTVEKQLAIMQETDVIKSEDGLKYTFKSDTEIQIRANEIYGVLKLKFNSEQIVVEYVDPSDDEVA